MVAVFDAKWMDAIVLLLGKYSYADHMVVVQILSSISIMKV